MNDRANTAMLHAARAALPAGPALSAGGLRVRLGDALVLHDVSVDFAPARWTAIVGPNGAGKSTLLRALAGLLAADGERRLHGVPVLELPLQQRARRLAWLAQQGEAPSELSAIDIVRLGRLPRHGLLGAPDDDDEAAVQRAMQRCECTAFADRRLSTLSGGERQRVLLARALAVQAPVLLLDEPTTHLDPPHQAALVRLMREEADAGAAVVSVMHELTLALAADWLVVLARGRLVAQGPADDAAVRDALAEVFDDALRIERVPTEGGGAMWAALPRLGGRR